ncbi:antitoxin Xre-like helix-turn-helix domain-containing protein [Alteromonas sp. CNT1-28]|jgi:hypothetical protein|uniref:antitoxin Xre-like helix-turn-helix domain-containing protein n=1 Tax=Alteromonas sp. CNT1-28 TaxID=2917730 RepID=UPI0031B82C27
MSNHIDSSSALKLCIKILNHWGCTTSQKASILGLSEFTLHKLILDAESPDLTTEQLERLSYIVNIHMALKSTFSNIENVYGFMSMKNHNEFFSGRSPLSIIFEKSSSIHSLREVYRRIESIGKA